MSGTPDQVLRNIAFTIAPEKARYPARNTSEYSKDSCYGAVAHYLREHGMRPHDTILMFGIHPTDVTHCILSDHHKVLVDTFAKDGGFTELNEGGLIYIAPNKELRRNVIIPLISSKTIKWFEDQYFKDETAKVKSAKLKIVATEEDLLPVPQLSNEELNKRIKEHYILTPVSEDDKQQFALSLGLTLEQLEVRIIELFSQELQRNNLEAAGVTVAEVTLETLVDPTPVHTEGELQKLINKMLIEYFVNIQTVQVNQINELSIKLGLTTEVLNKYIYDLLSRALKQMKEERKNIALEGLIEYLPKNTPEGELQKLINKMIIEYFVNASNVDAVQLREFATRVGLTEDLMNRYVYDLLSRAVKQIKLESEGESVDAPTAPLPSLNM